MNTQELISRMMSFECYTLAEVERAIEELSPAHEELSTAILREYLDNNGEF
jgi:hypothetical protein